MEKTIGVTKARDDFRRIIDEVQHRGDKYVINRHGKPAVAVVPVQVYENWKQQRRRLLELIREVQSANPDADPDEVMQDVLEAQQAIRAQRNWLRVAWHHAHCARRQHLCQQSYRR